VLISERIEQSFSRGRHPYPLTYRSPCHGLPALRSPVSDGDSGLIGLIDPSTDELGPLRRVTLEQVGDAP
jgi:hypothetical protein